MKHIFLSAAALLVCLTLSAQKYKGIVDKTVAVVGGETILLSDIEAEVQQMRATGAGSDRDLRCEVLENMLDAKIFLMQARIDSLTVNNDMVQGNLAQRIDWFRTQLGGDEEMEKYFGKPLYKLRQEWQKALEEQSLTEQERMEIAGKMPEVGAREVSAEPDLPVSGPRKGGHGREGEAPEPAGTHHERRKVQHPGPNLLRGPRQRPSWR